MILSGTEPFWYSKRAFKRLAVKPRPCINGPTIIYHFLKKGRLIGVVGHIMLEDCCLCIARVPIITLPTYDLPIPTPWNVAKQVIDAWQGKDPNWLDGDE